MPVARLPKFTLSQTLGSRRTPKNQDSLEVEIKTEPREANIKMVSLDVMIFNTRYYEVLLHLLVVLRKILKGDSLN